MVVGADHLRPVWAEPWACASIRIFIAYIFACAVVDRSRTEAMTNAEMDCGRALCEDDIPGASLGGRSANTLTVPALKRWLQCRAAPTKGKKADLVER